MVDFPVRGQKAPNFWNEQLKAWIEQQDTFAVNAANQSLANALTGYWTKSESDGRYATTTQGAKADTAVQPAGQTSAIAAAFAGTDLGTADLNTIRTPGVYRQPTTANATLAANYPAAGRGSLEVLPNSGTAQVIQRYTVYGDSPSTMRVIFMRRSTGASTWDVWRSVPTQRVVQPVGQPGVEIYTWDEINNVERQVPSVGNSLGTIDLDLVTVAGLYYANVNINATLARHYPIADHAGLLEVLPMSSAILMQRFTPHSGGGQQMRVVYQRRTNGGGTWDPWRVISTQRVDVSAGRAIYTWDDVNSREQLIYGDTGWRDITSLIVNGFTADSILVRRTLSSVTYKLINVNGAAASSITLLPYIVGFMNAGGLQKDTGRGLLINVSNDSVRRISSHNSGMFFSGGAPFVGSYYGEFTFSIDAVWPTSVPGTAVGTIPNL